MRYLSIIIVLCYLVSCECEDLKTCDDHPIFVEIPQELDSIICVIPNIWVREEQVFTLLNIDHENHDEDIVISEYEFEIKWSNDNTYSTADTSFIFRNNAVQIPTNEAYQNMDITEGFKEFSVRLSLANSNSVINISGQFLFTTCESILDGSIDVKDCRYSNQVIPALFDEPSPFVCD